MTPGDVVKYRFEKWTVSKVGEEFVTLYQYRPHTPSIRTVDIPRSQIAGLKISGELQIKKQEDGK